MVGCSPMFISHGSARSAMILDLEGDPAVFLVFYSHCPLGGGIGI